MVNRPQEEKDAMQETLASDPMRPHDFDLFCTFEVKYDGDRGA